jgi:hypothetical protein
MKGDIEGEEINVEMPERLMKSAKVTKKNRRRR